MNKFSFKVDVISEGISITIQWTVKKYVELGVAITVKNIGLVEKILIIVSILDHPPPPNYRLELKESFSQVPTSTV
jgi:hypothetical protein